MQGTVKDYERESRTGTLLTDDETEVLIDAGSMEGSGIRYLRVGQRVKFDLVEDAGRKLARSLRIVTFD